VTVLLEGSSTIQFSSIGFESEIAGLIVSSSQSCSSKGKKATSSAAQARESENVPILSIIARRMAA
jgi:hypothetical protein